MQICLGLAPQAVQRQGSKTSRGKILANMVMMLAGREAQVGRFLTLFDIRTKHFSVFCVSQDSKLQVSSFVESTVLPHFSLRAGTLSD